MEERSLKVLADNTTFFSRISNGLTKLLIPTSIGVNGILISIKRNSTLKAYENYEKEKDNNLKVENNLRRYEESYTLYLESIDKYIMDSVYKKVKSKKASTFEKNALSEYYNIIHLKEKEYAEYKARKQKFLLDLDYESILSGGKEKLIKRYRNMYIEKNDELYKSILKHYSVKLADGVKEKGFNNVELYKNVFLTLSDYVRTILPLKIENNFGDFEKIRDDYEKLQKFDTAKLEEKDFLEKNMVLLGISRVLFTHSFPLLAAEKCYEKLIKDARNLIISSDKEEQKEENYKVLLKIIENFNDKLQSTKVYWENPDEREIYKKFSKEYERARTNEKKEVAFIRKDMREIKDNGPKSKQIIKFYREKLEKLGAIRNVKNSCRTIRKVSLHKKVSV